MQDNNKTQEQLTNELKEMRQTAPELETAQATSMDAENKLIRADK
jgi:hypothetical protein